MRWLRYGTGALLAVLWSAPLVAQTPSGTVRGRITDEGSQRPLQGATVVVGSRTAVSQADGRYTIAGVPAGTDSLKVRMIGYTPLTVAVTVNGGMITEQDIALAPHAVELAEMVSIGYGEQQAGNVTGAVTSVKADEFNTGRIITPTELIQNKAAGVQVVDNNEPGGGKSIRVRGPTSVNASNEPLYVIDGVPVGFGGGGVTSGRDPLNFINADDIESITVLRDASAAAIYGANAANGVVIINTKRGAVGGGAPKFEYTGTVSASTITKTPDMLNAAQFRTAVNTYAGPSQINQLGTANTDWFKQVDRTGYGQEHNLAVSGGSPTMDYRLSFNYLNQNGIMRETGVERFSLGAVYNQRLLSDRLGLRINLRGTRSNDTYTPGGVIGNAAQMGPTQPVFDTLSTTGFYEFAPTTQSPDNPYALLRQIVDRGNTFRAIGNVQTEYQVQWVPGLKANLNVAFDVSKAERESFTPSTAHPELKTGNGGTYFRSNPNFNQTSVEGFLNYVVPRSVGPGTLDLTGGYSWTQNYGKYPEIRATGLSTDVLGIDGIPQAAFVTPRLFVEESKLASFFGRVNYNIKDRYILAASIRRDASSRFGPGHEWGTFPSVSGAWRLSQESFFQNIASLSDLKLRASWARTGNQAIANFQQFVSYTVGDAQTQYQFGDSAFATIRPSGADANVKWEATRSVDIGLDFGFSNQRWSGSIDWYDKKTDDMLFRVPVAAGTNNSNYLLTNIGSMRNRGVELSFSAKILQGNAEGGLRWTADFTAAHNSNELLTINPLSSGVQQIETGNIAGGVGTRIQLLTPGEAVNSFWVYQTRMQNGKPVQTDQDGDNDFDALDLYKDLNGDGIINNNDRRISHDPAPKWIFGHSSYMSYGKFDLSFTLRAYTGNYVYNNVASNLGTYAEVTRNSPFNLHKSVLETGFLSPQHLSDYYVEDASFLRMDNITVGYNLELGGRPARLFATMQNAFTITGYSGVDPTAGINGIDNNLYPRSRTFTSGMNLRF